ncbi:iron ABC transporter substrate-binding protein [Actinomadura sp. 6K520]|jgi:iron(III) transport system substrate-binding protein|uniref:iron ABC transporter substrate-binding protein n=1 Tax=Actinomadura sp. 6K520 TaxID=2530364 RepID=UPI00104F6EBE|nr:iron ABC transporter substrate-binding protein [Actinomadura sp. 6K520]TDE37708.1 iron ABC transporter substrate-binding protein [Actinomadura sp. 6K520]
MRHPLRRFTTALALAAVILPMGAACGLGSDAGLIIYSGRNEGLIKPLLDRLEDAVGTGVEVRYGASSELSAQILEEGDGTKADLFLSQDAGALGALAKAGRLEKLPQPTLDKVAGRFRSGTGDWVGLSGRVRVIAYNPNLVAKAPDTVRDLVKPEWKGKIAYAPTNASFQAFVTGMRVLDGDDVTRKWLEGLKANGVKAYENNIAVLDAVDAGQIGLGLINHYYWYERVAEKGESGVTAKLHYLPGADPGALINVAGVGVLKGAAHPATAQKAVDFLLSKEAQTYFSDETKEYPLASGVTSNVPGLPPLDSLKGPEIDLGELESLQETLTMLREAGMV